MEQPYALPQKISDLFIQSRNIRSFSKGQYLFQEGTSASEVYYIRKGLVQLIKVVPDGRELTIRMSSVDTVLGEFSLFCKESVYMLSAKVVEDTEVSVISKDAFESYLSSNPDLTLQWLQWIQLQSQKNQTKFRDLLLHGKKGALYSTLIRLTNSSGQKVEDGILISHSMTNQELANFCGTSREVINRLLGELKKNNILSLDKGYLTIHNLQYLKDEIDCENCPISICRID